MTIIQSHPSRGAWIEMPVRAHWWRLRPVAPLAGCVDLNQLRAQELIQWFVAPLAGCVD